ncbi:MAG: DUF4102 domain-containing protein [Alphaproteobacteria bacterium]|nr:DUF4102 domain-containing protein [Alphaproteobacteria bacterium]MCK5658947.1 DUF4102 domain-containing protein [Alphaproteobacteria bacterium]
MLALGKYPAVSLSEARKLRDEAREQVKAGKHPTREKKAQRLRSAYEGENTCTVLDGIKGKRTSRKIP